MLIMNGSVRPGDCGSSTLRMGSQILRAPLLMTCSKWRIGAANRRFAYKPIMRPGRLNYFLEGWLPPASTLRKVSAFTMKRGIESRPSYMVVMT
jgi:hypothetical protein